MHRQKKRAPAPPAPPKGRLPHRSGFILFWNAEKQEWYGSMLIGMSEELIEQLAALVAKEATKGVPVIYGEHQGAKRLMFSLDDKYRRESGGK